MAKELNPKSSTGSFVLVIVTMIMMIILMVLFLHFVDKDNNAKPLTQGKSTTTKETTTEKIDPIFNTSLTNVIEGYDFNKLYEYDIYYQGATFNIKCNKYDEDNKECVENTLTLKIDDVTYGLYINDPNLINNAKDYYFIVNREYVIVTDNIVNKSPGKIRFYDLKGNLLKEFSNVITGFTSDDKLIDKLYPTLEDDEFKYYSCSNGIVRFRTISISDNFEQKSYENIKDSKCFD